MLVKRPAQRVNRCFGAAVTGSGEHAWPVGANDHTQNEIGVTLLGKFDPCASSSSEGGGSRLAVPTFTTQSSTTAYLAAVQPRTAAFFQAAPMAAITMPAGATVGCWHMLRTRSVPSPWPR